MKQGFVVRIEELLADLVDRRLNLPVGHENLRAMPMHEVTEYNNNRRILKRTKPNVLTR